MNTQPKDLRAELASVLAEIREFLDNDFDIELDTIEGWHARLTAALTSHGGGGEAAIPLAGKWLSDRDMEATQEWCDGWNTCAQYFGGKYTTPPTPSAPATLESEVLDFITAVPGDRCHRMLVERGWKPPSAPVVDDAMVERAIDAADRVFAKHFGSLPGADDVDTEMMRAALTAALSEVTVDETTPRCGGEQYELDAYIWKRESTQEWVLELSGTIGDAHFISRHCEPLATPPEDVAGLPSMYAAIQGESHD